ncbi:chorismate mutase [uncultured bacterium]|nr:chorismate mutase [uncultured bacterium]
MPQSDSEHISQVMQQRLEKMRAEVDHLDDQLADLLMKRFKIISELKAAKNVLGKEIYQPMREREIIKRLEASVMDTELFNTLRNIFERILDESRAFQSKH